MRLTDAVLGCMRGMAGAGLAVAVGCSAISDARPISPLEPVAHSAARLIPIAQTVPAEPPQLVSFTPPPAVVTPASAPPEDLRDEVASRRKRQARALAQQRAAQQQQAYIRHVYCGRG